MHSIILRHSGNIVNMIFIHVVKCFALNPQVSEMLCNLFPHSWQVPSHWTNGLQNPRKSNRKKSGFSILLIHLFSNLIVHFIACPVRHVLKLSNIWKSWGPDFYIVDSPLGILTWLRRQSQAIPVHQFSPNLQRSSNHPKMDSRHVWDFKPHKCAKLVIYVEQCILPVCNF